MHLATVKQPFRAAMLAALAAAAGSSPSLAAPTGPEPRPLIESVSVGDGGHPFAGDRRLLATVTPNGDGYRDEAVVRFSLSAAADVTLAVYRTRSRARRPVSVWRRSYGLAPGRKRLVWRPRSSLPARTYLVRLTAVGRAGEHAVVGRLRWRDRSVLPGPVVRIQGVDAGFAARSYAPGARGRLVVRTDARQLSLELFQAGPEWTWPARDDELYGVPVGGALSFDWSGRRDRPASLAVPLPQGPSGLYFARLTADDGRVGFAPLILGPDPAAANTVAVVLPTNTWEAYNHRDVDGDGWGDTWYAVDSIPTVDLARPYLDRGVPHHFRHYHLGFQRWLYRTGKRVDFLADDDLEAIRTGDELARRYTLVVFAGHEEYVTSHVFSLVRRYRDLGGNLAFLSANNLFWRVERHGTRLHRVARWRDLGRHESMVIGVEYVSNDGGRSLGRYVVVGAARAPWAFAGTGLANGDRFGHGGIEIDARTPHSPPGTTVLAAMPRLHASGASAEMTYYETPAGAKVFAAGTLNFGGAIGLLQPPLSIFMQNVWARLVQP